MSPAGDVCSIVHTQLHPLTAEARFVLLRSWGLRCAGPQIYLHLPIPSCVPLPCHDDLTCSLMNQLFLIGYGSVRFLGSEMQGSSLPQGLPPLTLLSQSPRHDLNPSPFHHPHGHPSISLLDHGPTSISQLPALASNSILTKAQSSSTNTNLSKALPSPYPSMPPHYPQDGV